jgi:outer membrane lipopolysaccharide assembly protein LptE/RlpB
MILKNNKNGVSTKGLGLSIAKIKGSRMPFIIYLFPFIAFAFYLTTLISACGIYRFNDATIPGPDSVKNIRIAYIENRAPYVNPQLSPRLTDKLRQKFNSQTKITLTNSEDADWELTCEIRDYALSTSAISGQQAANNRITVTIHIIQSGKKIETPNEYDISRAFEFGGNQTLQQAEGALLEEMIRTLTDEIFNKLFSNW